MAASLKNSDAKQLNLKSITQGDLTWVDILQPTEAVAKYLAEHYNFHPMDMEDSLSTRQLSKIEEYPQYLFVIFHLPVYDKTTRVSTRKQWSVFIGDKFLITLRPGDLVSLDSLFRECERSEDSREEYMSQGSGYLLYNILDRAIDAYFPVLTKIGSKIDDIEDAVFDEGVEVAREISMLRRDLITQRQVMFPTRTTIMALEKQLKRFSTVDLAIYFSDLWTTE
jgi:magnesium transporter